MAKSLLKSFRRPRPAHSSLRTARCVLVDGDRHLLVVHAGKGRRRNPVWGLPGGHIDPGEAPDRAARRELEEELYLDVGDMQFIDDYAYKGHWHRVYTAPWQLPISNFDDTELLEIGWFTLGEVQGLADRGALHAGYEIDVVRLLARSEQGMRAAG
ncbi:MAG: NUDIX hydrolase [Pseudomonadales bacterium]|nr:NUDIX hydrolase [Pseudomonadales bacterium]